MVSGDQAPRRVGTLWALEKDDALPAIRPRIAARFHEVEPDGIPQLAAAMAAAGPAPAPQTARVEIHQRIAGGRRCFAAWAAREVAAYGWASFVEELVGELDLRLRLLPGEAYIWDCATLPVFRRQGLFSALLVFMVTQLRAEGVQRIWIGADLDNVPSQRGIDRAGFRRVADLLVKPGAPARQGWLEGYPGVPEELVAGARRVLLGNIATTQSL